MSTDAPVTATRAKRIRRPAEEARRLILDAAEERLARQGPEGIRLQDIARDVGISHPAILHHFESRDGLVRALVARATAQLHEKLLTVLEQEHPAKDTEAERAADADARMLINDTFEALSDRGSARLLSWLMLTGRGAGMEKTGTMLTEITDRLHDQRTEAATQKGETEPSYEDTLFMAILTANAAFGEGIVGSYFMRAAGLHDDPDAVKRFRAWFAKLLANHSSPEIATKKNGA